MSKILKNNAYKYISSPRDSLLLAKNKNKNAIRKIKPSRYADNISEEYVLDLKTFINTQYNKNLDLNASRRDNPSDKYRSKNCEKSSFSKYDTETCDKNKNANKKVTFNNNVKKYVFKNPKENKSRKYSVYVEHTSRENNIKKEKKNCATDKDRYKDMITQRIVQYFENPKESSALAEIKRISERAKNHSSKNIIQINSSNNCDGNNNINNPFKRRKFQFPTQTYKPKNKNTSLIKELNEYQESKKKGKINTDDSLLCFDSESEDDKEKIINFNLDKNMPKKERTKYSSKTMKIPTSSVEKNLQKPSEIRRISFRYDTITEDYKERNHLIVEKINNKEKVIKKEYQTKNNGENNLNNYRTEYFWDNNIRRLIEKRIYFDEKNKPEKIIKNKYPHKKSNLMDIYNKFFQESNTEEENNITKAKIELNPDKKEELKKNVKNYANISTSKSNDTNEIADKCANNKPFVYSRKYKYYPYAKNKNNLVKKEEKNVGNNPIKEQEAIQPKNKVYKKRTISADKDKPFSIQKQNKYNKRPIEKNIEVNRKEIQIIRDMKNNSNERSPMRQDQKKEEKVTLVYGKKNRINNSNELIEDLGKIEQNNVDSYIDSDIQQIYNNISEEFTDFKSVELSGSLNSVESLIGTLDKCDKKLNCENDRICVNLKVNNLCKDKIFTRKQVYKKYTKRIINIA